MSKQSMIAFYENTAIIYERTNLYNTQKIIILLDDLWLLY